MTIQQIFADRVKLLLKEKKISTKTMLADLELNINYLSQAVKSPTGITSVNLFKIANYLNCSVDYLLGRTDNPELNKASYNIANVTNSANGTGNTVSIGGLDIGNDDLIGKTFDVFNQLPFAEKVDAMNYIVKLSLKGE